MPALIFARKQALSGTRGGRPALSRLGETDRVIASVAAGRVQAARPSIATTGCSSAWIERSPRRQVVRIVRHIVDGSSSIYFAYVLRSETTGRRYVGSCEDLNDRVRRHNNGESKATKHGVPWKVAYVEEFSTRAEAVHREHYFKTGKGRDELNRLEVSTSTRGVAQPG